MKRIVLYQLSDVHYPEHRNERALDVKDPGVPSALLEAIAPPRLVGALRELLRRMGSDPGCGIVICGDLTTVGSLSGYQQCVEYLVTGLALGSNEWPLTSLQVVPGNHDVNRLSVPTEDHDPIAKFDPLVDAWIAHSVPVLAARLRTTQMRSGGYGLDLYGLNSCVGCGEWRELPDDLRDKLAPIFKDDAETAQASDDRGRWERLDTPAFLEGDVDEVVAAVRTSARDRLAVVIAHHNLLPQFMPRISPYSELLNGGMLRERLCRLDRPILYLHGHIHTSPVEVLLQPAFPQGRLVSVAAPVFVQGFNRLAIDFAADGQPLGVEVLPIRVQDAGGFENGTPLRVSLNLRVGQWSPLTEAIIELLETAGQKQRYIDIRDAVRINGRRPAEPRLQDALREAEWLGWLRLVGRDEDARFWQVELVGR